MWASFLVLPMHTAVQKGPCFPIGTTLSGTSQPNSSLKCAQMLALSPHFWDNSRRSTFIDVRVFNAHAPSNSTFSTDACYRRHERKKRRNYEQRVIEVEHGTFTPLVHSSSGGWGLSATVAFKRLASLISQKYGQPYNSTLYYIRYRVTFSLIHSAVACLRGPRSSFHGLAREINLIHHPLDLIHSEVHLPD